MAEFIADIQCPATGEPAKLMRDKRGKLYVNSPAGVFKYQSDHGQELLRNLYEKISETPASHEDSPISEPSENHPDVTPEKTHTKRREKWSLFGKHKRS